MNIMSLFDNQKSTLPSGKADFLLALSVTETCNIEGISQAGLPGMLPLTPTLDAEFLKPGKIFSLDSIPETTSGIPSPVLLTRAASLLSPFSNVHVLNLGVTYPPKEIEVINFDLTPSPSIASADHFDAKKVLEKGLKFGTEYHRTGDFVILAECVPSGTTTAQAAVRALGLTQEGLFSSSFKNAPVDLKSQTITKSMEKLTEEMDVFERLGHTADQMQLFYAGFILSASQRFNVVLGGGTQMAAVLLIADKIAQQEKINFLAKNITLCTTRWVAQDGSSNINALLSQLSFSINAVYADFSYEDANIPVLKLYDDGEAKEGVGAGAAIAYAFSHGVTQKEITEQVEALMA